MQFHVMHYEQFDFTTIWRHHTRREYQASGTHSPQSRTTRARHWSSSGMFPLSGSSVVLFLTTPQSFLDLKIELYQHVNFTRENFTRVMISEGASLFMLQNNIYRFGGERTLVRILTCTTYRRKPVLF